MLKTIFLGMIEASNAFYGDSIGLAPIALASAENNQMNEPGSNEVEWARDFDR